MLHIHRVVLLVCTTLLLTASAAPSQQDQDVLAQLRPHPRLMLTSERLEELRDLHRRDEDLQRVIAQVLAQAEALLDAKPLVRVLRGPRLLHVSRDCLRRVQTLGLAWRWTNDQRFADRCRKDLATVAAFSDWNPSHFLDTAEMSHAVGVGYDWLWPVLPETERTALRTALVRLGLEPGRDRYHGKGAWWVHSAFNWNQVCNGGLMVGALAIADEEPELARTIVQAATRSLPTALASYDPDGAWMEGPSYWSYATHYTAYGLDALRTATGNDLGLSDRDGLRRAAWFPIHTAGPNGLFFNFADAPERSKQAPTACMLWLSRIYDEPRFAAAEHALLRAGEAVPMHVVWWAPAPPNDPTPELVRRFDGDVPVFVFRSAWREPDALFAAVKGGYNRVNHGHLDLSSFVLDALGVRWAIDLGSDDYNLPGYWQSGENARRWTYYRLGSRSHNVVLVGDGQQHPDGRAAVLDFKSGGAEADGAYVVLDLGAAWPAVGGVRRGMRVHERSLLVQDELELREATRLTWAMTTRAAITVDGDVALLRQGGQTLEVRALAPTGATWHVTSAEQAPPQRHNRGVSRLELHVAGAPGHNRIAVQLAPRWPDGTSKVVVVRALADW